MVKALDYAYMVPVVRGSNLSEGDRQTGKSEEGNHHIFIYL